MGVGWYLSLANIFYKKLMQLVEMFLQKAFARRKWNVGVTTLTIPKCTYKKQNNIRIQLVGYYKVIWIYLIVNTIPMLRIYTSW
jgi:hypothetical protein